MKHQFQNPQIILKNGYILALVLIAALALLSHISLQYITYTQRNDLRVVNLASRQVALGESLLKTALSLDELIGTAEYNFQLEELHNTLSTWQRTHKGLIEGDPVLQLPGENSEEVSEMFQELAPFYEIIAECAEKILSTENLEASAQRKVLASSIKQLQSSELAFKEIMNQISFQYEMEANGRLKLLKNFQWVLLALQLLLLMVLGYFLFRPMVNRFSLYVRTLKKQSTELEKLNQELVASEEEMKQNAEELSTMNEHLNNTKQELETVIENEQESKKMLQDAHQTLQQTFDELSHKSKQLSASINYAERIQRSLLPCFDTLKHYLPESFILFKPRDVVSGDFYWYIEKDYKLIVAAVDCMGHGVPGAFMSLIAERLLYEIIYIHGVTRADQILNMLHRRFRKTLAQEQTYNADSIDMAICVIEQHPIRLASLQKPVTLTYAGARNPLIYISEQQVQEIKGDKASIGGRKGEDERRFTQHEVVVEHPTWFYIFSDGYQDQFGGPKGRKFMKSKFKQLLLENHCQSMEEQRQALESAFMEWRNDGEGGLHLQIDDVLVMGFKLEPSEHTLATQTVGQKNVTLS